MANTRFNYDPCRTVKKLQEATDIGRYMLNTPGNGLRPKKYIMFAIQGIRDAIIKNNICIFGYFFEESMFLNNIIVPTSKNTYE